MIRPERNLLAVADGMGGSASGHIAARVAIDEIADLIPRQIEAESVLSDATERANKVVYGRARENPDLIGMGTTIVIMSLIGEDAVFCHVGDSRGYMFQDSKIRQVTKDHSLVQEQVDRGEITPEDARYAMNRSVVTQAIGPSMVVSPTTTRCKIEKDDVCLLCSDGLSEYLEEDLIEEILTAQQHDLARAVNLLIDGAAERGSTDNITVVLGKFE